MLSGSLNGEAQDGRKGSAGTSGCREGLRTRDEIATSLDQSRRERSGPRSQAWDRRRCQASDSVVRRPL